MTFPINYGRVLAELTRVHGSIKQRGLGISVSWVIRGNPSYATKKADLIELCLKALDLPYTWTRTDCEPHFIQSATRGKTLQTIHIRLHGSTFATAALRKALRQSVGLPKKDRLLCEAVSIAAKVNDLVRHRDSALAPAVEIPASSTPEIEPMSCAAERPHEALIASVSI